MSSRSRIWGIGVALALAIVGAAPASASTIYTPILSNVPSDALVECRVVNVGGSPLTVLVELVNGFGTVANTLSCPLPAGSSGPGCVVGGSPGQGYYCRFTAPGATKKLRAHAEVYRLPLVDVPEIVPAS
jgi:hypothetical protein